MMPGREAVRPGRDSPSRDHPCGREQDDVLPHEDGAGADGRDLADDRLPFRRKPPFVYHVPSVPYAKSAIGAGVASRYWFVRRHLGWVYALCAASAVLPPVLGHYDDPSRPGFWDSGTREILMVSALLFGTLVAPTLLLVLLRKPLAEWNAKRGLRARYRQMARAIEGGPPQDARPVGLAFGAMRRTPPGMYQDYLGLLRLGDEALELWWWNGGRVSYAVIRRESLLRLCLVETWVRRHHTPAAKPEASVPLLVHSDPATGQACALSMEAGDEVEPERVAEASGALYRELERWVEAGASGQQR